MGTLNLSVFIVVSKPVSTPAVKSWQYPFIILPKPSTTLHVLSNQCSTFSCNSVQMIAASLLSDHCSIFSWFRTNHKYLGCCYQTNVRRLYSPVQTMVLAVLLLWNQCKVFWYMYFRQNWSVKLIFHTVSGSVIHTCIIIKHTQQQQQQYEE